MQNRKLAALLRSKNLVWLRIGLIVFVWGTMLMSVAYADDCLKDITRAED